jgi:hypothetical protein
MATVTLCENVVFRSFGSETVLLNIATGQYHGLRGTGGRMLEVLSETPDLDAAARRIAEEYAHPVEDVRRDLQRMCEELADRALVRIEGAA